MIDPNDLHALHQAAVADERNRMIIDSDDLDAGREPIGDPPPDEDDDDDQDDDEDDE